MAGWLSSKLKEAEQFLQQIDQQAAESLGRSEQHKPGAIANDKHGAFREQDPDLLLATQKGFSRETLPGGKLELGKEAAPSAFNKLSKLSTYNSEAKGNLYNKQGQSYTAQSVKDAGDNVAKDDWTELLTSPNIEAVASPALASSVGSSDSGHAGHFKGSSSRFKSDTSKNGVRRPRHFAHVNSVRKVQAATSSSATFSNDGQVYSIGDPSPRKLFDNTLPHNLDLQVGGKEAGVKDSAIDMVKGIDTNGNEVDHGAGRASTLDSESSANVLGDKMEAVRDDCAVETVLTEKGMEGALDLLEQVHESSCLPSQDADHLALRNCGSKVVSRPFDSNPDRTFLEDTYHELQEETDTGLEVSADVSGNRRASLVTEADDGHLNVEGRGLSVSPRTPAMAVSLESDIDSYESSLISDTESDRESDSEADAEIERRKYAHKQRIARRRELAAARAAAAQAALRECQLFVEKLEKEEAALRHILAEREEQQGREAAELRLTIAELMQALEAEKKLHSSTRMKALAKESELENHNADLAKSLGALQWELQEQMSQVLKARGIVDAKEVIKAELERRIAKIQGDMRHAKHGEELDSVPGAKDGDLSFEEEHSDLWKKIQLCQIQVRDLEVKITGLKDTYHVPTEIEKELENHLAKLTDQLIQKQAQVEGLAAEKATLSIRLEGLYKAMEEETSQASRNKLGSQRSLELDPNFYDMEYGLRRSYDSKLKPSAVELGESTSTASSSLPLSPVLRQLNGFFSTGMFYLRKHRWAQACAVVYVIVLHLWFWFVVLNSRPT